MVKKRRITVSLDTQVYGPFPTVDAVAAVGRDMVERFSKTGGIFWADHSKRAYYAFQEVQSRHANNVSWHYVTAHSRMIKSIDWSI